MRDREPGLKFGTLNLVLFLDMSENWFRHYRTTFLTTGETGDATLESPPEQEVLPSQEPATPRNAAQGLNCQTKTLPQKICIYLASVYRL